ncbi:MAG TPA: restriction endonuclease [Candidatus Paceibacterota bacterium]|nr:restriction endonuclease [Candidatus Paceibacterota bacterium]
MTDILKADGTVEAFEGVKLEASLRRAGSGARLAQHIRETVERMIVPGMHTNEIYRRAFTLLRKETRAAAARYSLRRALFEFGPSGHPFEDFVAELFRKEGWEVQWRKTIPGKCISHEVDVYAKRGNEHLAAELKYHNDPNYKTDVKVALYVKARFDDIWHCDPKEGETCPIDRGYLITNTKFTESAIAFAKCSNIGLIGWSYPTEGNLYDRIVSAGIYPLTALTTLRKSEKRLLVDQGIVTSEQLLNKHDVLRELSVSAERVGAIMAEIHALKDGPSHS